MFRALKLGLVFCAVLSGCAGGTGSGLPSTPSAAPPVSAPRAGSSNIVIAIRIPATSSSSSALRGPRYISANTQSASIAINNGSPSVVNLSAASPNCTTVGSGRTCTLSVNAPIGNDRFTEILYAGVNAGGAVLSQATTSATIVAGTNNTIALTLDGVIASMSLTLSDATPPTGTPVTILLTPNFKDASGATIIGTYAPITPIALTDSDTSGATTLSKQVLNSPADAAGLHVVYSGDATLVQAVFGAKPGSIVVTGATLTPQQQPQPTPTPSSGPVSFNDYTTFGYDNQHDVFNPNTTSITPASLSSLHLAWQATLGGGDYNTQTQPILATGVLGHKGLLFVGGGTGNVYAYDALTGAVVWKRSTGQETYTCENNNAIYFGVGGTVAYDAASKSLYVVGNANSAPDEIAVNSLYHLDAGSGAVLRQVNFAPSVPGWPSLDFSHTSVTLGSNGVAYVGTGATCDISSWRGRIAAVNVSSMTLANTFYTVWNGTTQPWGGGGVWGWGGVSLDFSGNVLTGVGNTDNGSTNHGSIVPPFGAAPQEYSGLGDAFIAVSPDLSTLVNSHHPIPASAYFGDSVDLDLNGTPAVFRPNGTGCNPMAALQAKSGSLYLYDAAQIGRGPLAQYQLAPSTYADGFLGGPAFSPATGLLYAAVPSSWGSLYPPGLIAINPGCGAPSVAWHSAFGPDSYPSGVPRSVPAPSAGGVLFVGTPCAPDGNGGCSGSVASTLARNIQGAQRKPSICCAPPGSSAGALWALDASTGTVLNGGKPLITTSGPLRAPPTIDGNWVFVLDNNGSMYGLTIDASYSAVAARARSIDARMLTRWQSRPAPH